MLTRVMAIFMGIPVISNRSVPTVARIGLGALVTYLVYLATPPQGVTVPSAFAPLLVAVAREAVFGLLIGFVASLLFTGIQIAGHFIGMQVGFGLANVIDPITQEQGALLDQFYVLVAGLVFLGINGHHQALLAVQQSFELVPLMGYTQIGPSVEQIVQVAGMMLEIGLRLSLPIMGTLLLIDTALAIVARTMPQLNVFIIGLPLKIVVGLLLLAISMPVLVQVIERVLGSLVLAMLAVVRAGGGV